MAEEDAGEGGGAGEGFPCSGCGRRFPPGRMRPDEAAPGEWLCLECRREEDTCGCADEDG